ncbi:hypothetical protein Tco_1507588 [Tanacetum coccineum]
MAFKNTWEGGSLKFEVRESLAIIARQARHALSSSVDYGFINTMDASIRASESRAMTAMGEVNERVTDLAATHRHRLALKARARPWRLRSEHCRGMSVYFRDKGSLMARGVERLQELQGEGWFEWVHEDDVAKTVFRMRNGHVEVTAMPFGLTNAPTVFMELMSRSKEEYESHVKMIVESLKEEKMYVKFSNNMEAEQRGSYLDVEGINWGEGDCLWSRQLKVLMKDLSMTTLTNRWLSMKKVIASCGSKYLAYLEVEVEYQGSSGLLLQPELPEYKWERITKDIVVKLPSVSSEYDAIWV